VVRVARWLKDFNELEQLLNGSVTYKLADVARQLRDLPRRDPCAAAALARAALGLVPDEPVRDICGLLEAAGIKVYLLESDLDGFFGLSVAEADGGPAVAVNVADRVTVERRIFTAAHELGHLLLHPGAYDTGQVDEDEDEEREADLFAGHFLMPQEAFAKQWRETAGLPLVERALHVKRLFRVSYKTVLHRLIELGQTTDRIWMHFAAEYKRRYRKSLGRKEEPVPLVPEDFVEDRLSRMVRDAVERQEVSLNRAAEILGVDLQTMRERVASWEIAA
jgi:Zn-dependent peptidase ImmA (M78 family)